MFFYQRDKSPFNINKQNVCRLADVKGVSVFITAATVGVLVLSVPSQTLDMGKKRRKRSSFLKATEVDASKK